MVDAAFAAFAISHSGLRAQRIRMDVIANNVANINTTRTPQGGPFRRQMAIFSANLLQLAHLRLAPSCK